MYILLLGWLLREIGKINTIIACIRMVIIQREKYLMSYKDKHNC